MPGRIVMDQQRPAGSPDLKRKRSHGQGEKLSSNTSTVQSTRSPLVNGATPHGANGTLSNGVAPPTSEEPPRTNGDSSHAVATATLVDNGPPELDQSWRQSEQYKPLGLLIERTAQQCYHDLNKTLDDMAAVPTEPQQQQQPNGVLPHARPDASEASLAKKRLLMDFAHSQRDRFTKTLIISDWSRNEQEKARVIDVKVWQDKQRLAYENAERAIAVAKGAMGNGAKMANPNIQSAMEVLATGKASWIPDLGYIPPKRLGAKQLLKTLRGMNVTLATRLSMNEELPYYLNKYTIANGRATFLVPDEFEVDLSVADEDPSTPFYFIDIRLIFSPASTALDDRVRGFLEGKVNQHLATHGLQGCYDFLHNFVLTHKLNVLRSQAADLIKGKWFDCIRVENLRRSLVVQYWTGMSGQMSWIEIGVSSGHEKGIKMRRPPTPRLAVRWFQKGIEIKDQQLHLNRKILDMEDCLMQAIEKHTTTMLTDLSDRIRSAAADEAQLRSHIIEDGELGSGKSLSLFLPSMQQPLAVRIEPVTGQFSISPPSVPTLSTQRRLGNDAPADGARRLSSLMCVVVQERTRREAELLGWSIPGNLARQDNLTALFGAKVQHFSIFSPGHAWRDQWALAVTFSLSGERWWVVELRDKPGEHVGQGSRIIGSARSLIIPETARRDELTVSRSTLLRLQRWATADIDLHTMCKQLLAQDITYTIETLEAKRGGEHVARQNTIHPTALLINFSKLTQSSQDKESIPWAEDIARLTHCGLTTSAGSQPGAVRHDLRLCLKPDRMQELQKHLKRSKERDLVLTKSRGLILQFITPFGEPFVQQIRERLRSVELLDYYATVLKRAHLPCTHLSLSRLAFSYSKTPELNAELCFSSDSDGHTQLKLLPADSNPQHRIRVILEQGFNRSRGQSALVALAKVLGITLPVLQAFDRLELKEPSKRLVSIHVRTSTHFSISYHAPLAECTFQLASKIRTEGGVKKLLWILSDVRASEAGRTLPEDLNKALKELFQDSREHWQGIANGIAAEERGAAGALEEVDEVIRKHPPSVTSTAQPDSELEHSSEVKKTSPEPTKPVKVENTKSESKPARAAPSAPARPIKEEHEVITLD